MKLRAHTYQTYKRAMDLILKTGLSYRETAKLTGVSVSTIQNWMADLKECHKLYEDFKNQD